MEKATSVKTTVGLINLDLHRGYLQQLRQKKIESTDFLITLYPLLIKIPFYNEMNVFKTFNIDQWIIT